MQPLRANGEEKTAWRKPGVGCHDLLCLALQGVTLSLQSLLLEHPQQVLVMPSETNAGKIGVLHGPNHSAQLVFAFGLLENITVILPVGIT